MATTKVFVVLLALLYLQGIAFAAEYYVRSSSSTVCPSDPCHILSKYAEDPNRYFISGSNFTLLEGEHHLNTTLVLSGVTGVILRGYDPETTTISIAAGGSITWNNSQDVMISSLSIIYEGTTAMTHTALIFEDITSVQISNAQFIGVNTKEIYSQALRIIQSTASLIECYFTSWHSINGGAIFTDESIVIFSGLTTFMNNTSDESGGGIYASNNSKIVFNGTNIFLNNNAKSSFLSTGGGGLYGLGSSIEFDGISIFRRNQPVDESVRLIGSSMYVYNSTLTIQNRAHFSENSGKYSGAIEAVDSNIFLEGEITLSDNRLGGTISIFRCNFSCVGFITFMDNDAFFSGSAMYISNSTVLFGGEVNFTGNSARNSGGGALYGFKSTIQFQGNTRFVNNSATGRIGGAIYMEQSTLICEGSTTFAGNSVEYRGGGVYAIDSIVNISGRAMFSENRAVQGGGVGLEGSSQLLLHMPVMVDFDHNIATSKGGALLVDASAVAQCQNASTVERSNCFFRIEDANASNSEVLLYFTQNSATKAGTVLYGGSLQFCGVQVDGEQVGEDSLEYFHNISSITHADESSTVPYISSDPLRACFCNNGSPDCSDMNIKNISVSRGQQFNLSVIAVGQGDLPVPSTIRAYINNFDNATELTPQSHMISGACTNITFRLHTEGMNKTLILYPSGPCGNTDNTRREIHMMLTPCPPGFDQSSGKCVCDERLTNLSDAIKCDENTAEIDRPGNSWIDPIFDGNDSYAGFILHRDCPLGFCRSENEKVSFRFAPNISDTQCLSNRTGILCGACRENHSLTLNSFNCKECSNSFIGLLLFFGLAGVALIVLLLVLHITVAAGTINGLILYANIVNANGLIFFPPDKDGNIPTNILRVFISWMNLDFGIETCFYNGLDFYSYAWLNYIFPFYLWFLIGVIIFSSRFSVKIGKLFGSNPVAVLATVILMSYTKLLEANIIALAYTNLEYPDGNTKRVWIFDANITHFKGKHIFLTIAAICVIFFLLLPYFFLLMFGYRLQAFSSKRAFSWLNKFKPLLDAYYAPYRKNTRYWTGFMLLVRTCLYLSFSFNTLSNSSANLVAISSVFTAIALIPWLSNRIYEKFYNDILEASFILNICLLSSATYHVRVRAANDQTGNQVIVTYLSIGIAFLQFLGIVFFNMYLRLKDNKVFKSLGRYLENLTNKFRSAPEEKKTEQQLVSVTTVELREPLLESETSQ